MPLYEYQCARCQRVHEVMQKFSDAPMTVCPDCQGPVQKLMSKSSFALKGTGWYTTDYKRAPAPTPARSSDSSDAPSASAPAAASGSDAKPAAPAAAPAASPAKSDSSGGSGSKSSG